MIKPKITLLPKKKGDDVMREKWPQKKNLLLLQLMDTPD